MIYRKQIKTLKQAIESAAKDNDLRWFLSLTDQSIITLIKNWIHYASADDETHKESIKNVSNNIIHTSCCVCMLYNVTN